MLEMQKLNYSFCKDIMIYPLLGVTTGLGLFIYTDQRTKKEVTTESAPSLQKIPLAQRDTFSESTISDYTELKEDKNKFVLYSKLHKQPLVTHRIITKGDIQTKKQGENQARSISAQVKGTAQGETEKVVPQQQARQEVSFNRNQSLYTNFFATYAEQLIISQKCDSVQLFEGPIFPKDTPYKQKSQKLDQVFTSTLKLTPSGQYLTDKYFTIVVCNSKTGHYLNGFTMRRGYASDTFNLTRYLTSLIKIQQQTGLKFNIEGEPLILADFDNLNKERKYSDFELKE